MFNFTLPNMSDLGSLGEEGNAKKVKSYLFQLTEQLRYVLNNIDTENFSPDIAKQFENTVNISESFAKIEDFLNNRSKDTKEIQAAIVKEEQNLQDIYHELVEAIAASATTLQQEFSNQLDISKEALSSTFTADYAYTSYVDSLEEKVFSQFKQTAEDMMAIFSETYSGEIEDLGDFNQAFSTYIRFSLDGIEIGKEDSLIIAKLSNNKLSFIQKGTGGEYEVAYISNKKLYITEANITMRLTLGSSADGMFYDINTDPAYGLRMTIRKA